MRETEVAILAGGCFWCLEAVYQNVRGVSEVVPGYIGGQLASPTYEAVSTGQSGHAEAVRIEFDPQQISFRDLLEIFFVIHDPTQLNRQGHDVGSQYRSGIFWLTEEQAQIAGVVLTELADKAVYAAPIVTELVQATIFYVAEAYHHNYYRQHPQQGYCAGVVAPKLAKFREKFKALRLA